MVRLLPPASIEKGDRPKKNPVLELRLVMGGTDKV
jgi:hypothetical protein